MHALTKPLAFCLDAFLLGLFLLQAFLLGCFLTLGYLPLPKSWVEHFAHRELPEGVEFRAEAYHLYPNGTILIDAFSLRLTRFERPVFEGRSARLEIDFFSDQKAAPQVESLIVSGGQLYLPPAYSPSGQRMPLFRQIRAGLRLDREGFTLDSFSAKHRELRVRGSAHLPHPRLQETNLTDIDRAARELFTQANRILRETSKIKGLKSPTLSFQLDRDVDGTHSVEARLTSRELNRAEMRARDLSLETRFKYAGGELINDSSVRLEVAGFSSEPRQIEGRFLHALIEQDQWQKLRDGAWPDLELVAASLSVESVILEQPRLTLNLQHLPELAFAGTTSGLNGAVRFDGTANLKDRSARVRARGSVDLLRLVGDDVRKRLPEINFSKAPHYDLRLDFAANMMLEEAFLRSEINDLAVDGIHFDHIRTEGRYRDGQFDFPKIFMQRDWQWLKLGLAFDRDTLDYRLRLHGSAKPDDYNSILPRWWGPIFKDFSFKETEKTLGDFIVYGNATEKAARLFYGSVQARNVSYKGVAVDQGELRVRGRGPYAEIFRMKVRQPDGWVRGAIRFTSRLDEIRGPAAVRLDLEARLGLQHARKLFDENVAAILDEFETAAPVEAAIEGAVFNRAYPEFEGMSFMNIRAQSDAPLRYKKIPLEGLSFRLFGRDGLTHLRDLRMGFAGGTLEAHADVFTPKDAAASLRLKGNLKGADQAAVDDLLAEVLQLPEESEPADDPKKDGRLDLKLHAGGPVDNITGLRGYGQFEITNERLSAIQLFGPISKLLERSRLGYTTFALERMRGDFELNREQVNFGTLQIDGPRTRIEAPGRLDLSDQSLDMRVSVYLFGNAGNPGSQFRKLTDFVSGPVPNLLEFELTGTLRDQKWRSLYDPRNLLPDFLNPANF